VGKTLEDVVQQVILKTIAGRRKWDPNKGDLVPWLKMQIVSVLDALAKSAPHRYEVLMNDEENQEVLQDKKEYNASRIDPDSRASQDPELIAIEQEEIHAKERDAELKIDALFRAVAGEAELEEILDAIMSGCDERPRYLAEELNISVEEVYNRKKRLRRRALTITKDFHNEKAESSR